MNKTFSKYSLLLCYFAILLAWLYYPKWKNKGTESTISWDVSGYYMYLPSIFIYNDVKELKFAESILREYNPTPDFQQAFKYENGNYVFKYPSGQALVYSPFFATGHLIAKIFNFPQDGFSIPYQLSVSLGSILIAFIGLFYLRRFLLEFFDDVTTAIVLVFIALGTNYLNYAGIDGPMTHSTLFSLYCLLLNVTNSFYKKPTLLKALGLGFLVGLAALIRPTEIISCLIPLLWNLNFPLKESVLEKFQFIKSHYLKLILAIVVCFLIGSIQLIYWKYVSGHWLVYSYQDQGFSWLHPHLFPGMFSYKAGWLVYSPMMFLALIGFVTLCISSSRFFITSLVFGLVFIYITFAWDVWWYGGLGIRAMVQSYAIFAIPLASCVDYLRKGNWTRWVVYPLGCVFLYYNFWLTYQAHGGLYLADQMTREYFWRTVGRINVDESVFKLLDTNEEFSGEIKKAKLIYQNDFEQDTTITQSDILPIQGSKSLYIGKDKQFSPLYSVKIENGDADWVRVHASYRCKYREWSYWMMTQIQVKFYNEDQLVKDKFLRVYRFLNDGDTRSIYFDVKVPKEKVNKVGICYWNSDSDKPLLIDDLKIEVLSEK